MKKPTLESMTLREKIGQTGVLRSDFIFKDKDYLKKYPFGGIWTRHAHRYETAVNNAENKYADGLDYRFTKECDDWIKELNADLKIPLLSAIDAETGANEAIPGCSMTPSAATLGGTQSEELTFKMGKQIATEALAGGANWIWGPVADNACMFAGVSLNRTYSCDMELSKRLIKAQIEGIQAAGVAATVKHFPGVDKREYRDPHFTQATIAYTVEEWEEYQKDIFQAAIDAGVYSVMTGHMSFPAMDDTTVDGNLLPTTLSYKIVTELLKEQMHFDGVVVTDGIGMGALTQIYPAPQLYIELLRAGNDMLLGPMTPDYIDVVEQAVLNGDLPEERINDACQRVLDMKEKLGLFDENYTSGGGVTPEMLEETRRVNQEVARKGMSLVCDKNGQLPLNKDKIKKVKIIYNGYSDNAFENLKYMKEAFEARGAECDVQRRVFGEIKQIAEEYDLIVYTCYIGMHSPYGSPYFVSGEIGSFNYILSVGKEKSIGISLGSPFTYFDYYSATPTYVNTYGYCRELCEEVVAGLYGEFEFNTFLPYPIRPVM